MAGQDHDNETPDAQGVNGPVTDSVRGERLSVLGELIKGTPSLPTYARPYQRGRARRKAADPIGVSGLPETRNELNGLLLELCNRLAAAGGQKVSGKRLVLDLGLRDERTLRLLMAYGHVHHRIRQLVGIEGSGYVWGDLAEGAYEQSAAIARHAFTEETGARNSHQPRKQAKRRNTPFDRHLEVVVVNPMSAPPAQDSSSHVRTVGLFLAEERAGAVSENGAFPYHPGGHTPQHLPSFDRLVRLHDRPRSVRAVVAPRRRPERLSPCNPISPTCTPESVHAHQSRPV